eukprot:TRINITY_DN2084_c0_g2_i2.p2 TRINITY_DN2084_c0_g2~~TRINITY_DN2084_c0_g2_i2.p2  ORF type:complete len:151 (+),score=40.30 TRINITY_DN2084_c0_g2_i2:137-589(+)
MIRRPPRSTLSSSSAASDVYKRQQQGCQVVISQGEGFKPDKLMARQLAKKGRLQTLSQTPRECAEMHVSVRSKATRNGRRLWHTALGKDRNNLPEQPRAQTARVEELGLGKSHKEALEDSCDQEMLMQTKSMLYDHLKESRRAARHDNFI